MAEQSTLSKQDIRNETIFNGSMIFGADGDEEQETIVASRAGVSAQQAFLDDIDKITVLNNEQKGFAKALGIANQQSKNAGVMNVTLKKKTDAHDSLSYKDFTLDITKDEVEDMLGQKFRDQVFPDELARILTKQTLLNALLHQIPHDGDGNPRRRKKIIDALLEINPNRAIADHDKKLREKQQVELVRGPVQQYMKSKSRIVPPPVPGDINRVDDKVLKELMIKVGGKPFDTKHSGKSLETYLKKLAKTAEGYYTEDATYILLQHILTGNCLKLVETRYERNFPLKSTWILLQTVAGTDNDMGQIMKEIHKILTTKPENLFDTLLRLETLVQQKNANLDTKEDRIATSNIDIEKYIFLITKHYYPLWHPLLKNEYVKAKIEASKSKKDFDPFLCLSLMIEQHIGADGEVMTRQIDSGRNIKMHAYEVTGVTGDYPYDSQGMNEYRYDVPEPGHEGYVDPAVMELMAYQVRQEPSAPPAGRFPMQPMNRFPAQAMNRVPYQGEIKPWMGRQGPPQASYGGYGRTQPPQAAQPMPQIMQRPAAPGYAPGPAARPVPNSLNAPGPAPRPNPNPFNGPIPAHLSNPPKCLLCVSPHHNARECTNYPNQYPDLQRPMCDLCRGYHEGGSKACRNNWASGKPVTQAARQAMHAYEIRQDQSANQVPETGTDAGNYPSYEHETGMLGQNE